MPKNVLRTSLLAPVVAVLLSGCQPATGMMLRVTADEQVLTLLASGDYRARLEIESPLHTKTLSYTPEEVRAHLPYLLELMLRPYDNNTSHRYRLRYTIERTPPRTDGLMAYAAVQSEFIPGQVRVLDLIANSTCAGLTCQTCTGGCDGSFRDPHDLPIYGQAAPTDASLDAASDTLADTHTVDGGIADASVDGGADAGCQYPNLLFNNGGCQLWHAEPILIDGTLAPGPSYGDSVGIDPIAGTPYFVTEPGYGNSGRLLMRTLETTPAWVVAAPPTESAMLMGPARYDNVGMTYPCRSGLCWMGGRSAQDAHIVFRSTAQTGTNALAVQSTPLTWAADSNQHLLIRVAGLVDNTVDDALLTRNSLAFASIVNLGRPELYAIAPARNDVVRYIGTETAHPFTFEGTTIDALATTISVSNTTISVAPALLIAHHNASTQFLEVCQAPMSCLLAQAPTSHTVVAVAATDVFAVVATDAPALELWGFTGAHPTRLATQTIPCVPTSLSVSIVNQTTTRFPQRAVVGCATTTLGASGQAFLLSRD